jgi:hypothetical protein
MTSHAAHFFEATQNVSNELGNMFNFTWANYLGLRELWWQIRAYKNTFDDVTMSQINAKFLGGVGLPGGIDLKKTLLDTTWQEHEQAFAKSILFEVCTIYECWLEEVCSIAFSNSGGKRASTQLQFPLGTLGENGTPADFGIAISVANNSANLSATMKAEFFPTVSANGLNCWADLDVYLKVYRYFKECRNSFVHSSGLATKNMITSYSVLTAINGWPALPFNHQMMIPAPMLGIQVDLSLNDSKLFATLVHRMIITLDAALCVTNRAASSVEERVKNYISLSGKGKWKNLPLSSTSRLRKVAGLLNGARIPKPQNLVPIDAWLTLKGII